MCSPARRAGGAGGGGAGRCREVGLVLAQGWVGWVVLVLVGHCKALTRWGAGVVEGVCWGSALSE